MRRHKKKQADYLTKGRMQAKNGGIPTRRGFFLLYLR